MRILILANNDVGLYKFRKELLQKLLELGYDVILSLPDGKLIEKLEDIGCKCVLTDIDRRGVNPLTDIGLLLAYKRLFKQIKPELVLTYTIKPNIYGGIMCRLFKLPYAVNITGLGTAFQKDGILKKLVIFLYKLALKRAKVVFFENTGNQQEFLKYKIVREEKTCVLNGAGVNLEEYPFCKYPECDTVRFLFIGRIMKEKGVEELFAVAEKIKLEYENVFFDVVGPMEDDYKERLEMLIRSGIIKYHGYQEDVRPFIRKCHCLVLPSYHEGMANTLLEAGAMGRPLITSRIHGCMEAVIEGENGYLVEPKNVEQLYDFVHSFLKLSYGEKICMGRKSRQHIENVFDKQMVVQQTIGRIME